MTEPGGELDPQELLAALTLVVSAAPEGRYPSYRDVASALRVPLAQGRRLLLRLEEIGWAKPPDHARGRHTNQATGGRQGDPALAVRSAVLALASAVRPTRAEVRRRLAPFDRELVDRVVGELLEEKRIHERGRWLRFGAESPPPAPGVLPKGRGRAAR